MSTDNAITRRSFLAVSGAALCSLALGGALAAEGDIMVPPRPDGEFLLRKGLRYFNCGSLGPTPRVVRKAALQAWNALEENPAEQGYGALLQAMEAVRAKAAVLLGCKVGEMALTHSTTDGMNTIAQGLGLAKGQHILTSDQEHLGGRLCWDYFARRSGVQIDTVTLPVSLFDPRVIVDRFAAKITADTKIISVSHVTYTTGLLMPVRELAELARARGCLLVVDGAQAPGGITVDVKALGCHAYATSGHKWLLGPAGTGLLYLCDDAPIDPLVLQSGRSAYTGATGVRDIPAVIGLGAALDYLTARGIAAVTAHNLALRNRLYAAIFPHKALILASPPPGPQATPLLTIVLPDAVDNALLAKKLADQYKTDKN